MNLDLRMPLVYARIDEPPSELAENDEILLCFDLDPLQSRNIEPDPDRLFGPLLFSGRLTASPDQAQTVSLPAGNYLFVQRRGPEHIRRREELLDMAIEQQKDGLWEMYRPENKLFVRYLYEDGCAVTQLFRPLP